MQTLEKLNHCRRLKLELESTKERIKRLKSLAEYISPQLDLAGAKAEYKDKLAAYTAQLEELNLHLIERAIGFEWQIQELENPVMVLPPRLRKIIELRYFECKSWNDIVKETHYSKSHLFALHKQAIKTVAKQ